MNYTKDLEKYEQETGKKATWQGEITKSFIRWRDGKKNYYSGKKRVSVYITGELEAKWLEYMEENNINSMSKLIREAVKYFIKKKKNLFERDLPTFTHKLKERITTIKGNLQLIFENHNNELSPKSTLIINTLFNEINLFENEFIFKSKNNFSKQANYDLLLIEDNSSTVNLIEKYFNGKGYSCKSCLTGLSGLEELNFNIPKLILLDIILPDINGFEVCKKIKSKRKLEKIPIIYITAIPGSKVEENLKETSADGYILKPFDLTDLEFLFKYL